MWPTRNDGSYPSYCNNQNFDPSPLESILQDLIVAWYSSHQVHFINLFYRYDYDGPNDNDSLWSHEFTKHGTCAEEISALNSELKFFTFGITIFNKMNITV